MISNMVSQPTEQATRLQGLCQTLHQKRAVKIIAGIANFNRPQVCQIVRAASVAGATAVDVAARPDIIQEARALTNLPIFASCVNPLNLAAAVDAGADAVEVGNFDALYADGLFITADEVLRITEETLKRVQNEAFVSVTIPGHLSLETQMRLAKTLEDMGVNLLQTEGSAKAPSIEPTMQVLSPETQAALTLTNTQALLSATQLPIMTASGITPQNMLDAFNAGASAVGVGRAVSRLQTESEMINLIHAMMRQLPEPMPVLADVPSSIPPVLV